MERFFGRLKIIAAWSGSNSSRDSSSGSSAEFSVCSSTWNSSRSRRLSLSSGLTNT